MKKVFLDNLPIKKGKGRYIDWKNSVGYKVDFVYEDIKGELKIIDYNGMYLTIEKNNNFFKIKTDNFSRCKLGNVLGVKTSEYKYKIGDIVENKNIQILELIKIKKNNNYPVKGYKYRCLIDGNIQDITESNLSQGGGCPICDNKKVLKGVNDISTTHSHLVKYFVDIEDTYNNTYGSKQKVSMRCPDCGCIKPVMIYLLNSNGFSCPECGDGISYPEKFMYSVLKQLNLEFETQYNPEWIKPKRYDFYFKINNKEYIIETDGYFHSNNNHMNDKSKEETKVIDDYKDEKALEHDISVIRINSEKSVLEFLKNNILQSQINDLFDLSKVDWLKCHEYACSNLVKTACDLWEKESKSVMEICSILKLSNFAINKYLNQGTILGWCNYNGKNIMRTNGKTRGKQSGKKIICITNGKIFDSAREANRILGIDYHGISDCCRGKTKSAGKINNIKLVWMFYEDYLKTKETI